MKVAVATMSGGLDDMVSPVFGRCQTFTLVECEGKEIKDAKVAENKSFNAAGGAGVQAAQFVAGEKAKAVISGNFGPNASAVLSSSEVEMIQAQGNVREVVEKYLKGELSPVSSSTVDLNYGKGGGPGFGGGRGGGFGRGRGGGMGQGGGGGRGGRR